MTPQEENIEAQRRATEEQNALTEANKAAADATEKARAANLKIENATLAVVGQFQKLIDVQLKYQMAMAKGQKGAAQFNDSVDLMSDTMQMAVTALSLLVPGGIVIKGVVAGLTFLATNAIKSAAAMQKAANEQGDALKKAYDAMSKSGATASDGMTGLFKDVNKMRLNVNQLDAMAAVMANSGKEMTAMGGTVYKARKEFANLVQGMGDYEQGMLNLGMNYDEQAEAAMGYMKLQANLSQGQQKDYGKLAGGLKKYLEETEALTRVTGMNRKEQEAAQEKYMAQQRFGAKVQQLMDEGKVEEAKLLQSQMKKYAAKGDMFAQAFADMTTGMITSDAAMKGNMSTQGKMLEEANAITEGRIKTDKEANESFQETMVAVKGTTKQFNALYQAGVGEDFLLPFKEGADITKAANQDFAKQIAEAGEEVKKLINSTDDVDDQLKRFTSMLQRQNEEMLELQRKLNGQFNDAGVNAGNFAKLLGDAWDVMTGWFTKLFGDQESNRVEYNKSQEKIRKDQEEAARKWDENWGEFGKTLGNSKDSLFKTFSDMGTKLSDMVSEMVKKLLGLIPGIDKAKELAGQAVDTTKQYAQKGVDTVKGTAGAVSDWFSSAYGTGFGGGGKTAGGAPAGGKPAGGAPAPAGGAPAPAGGAPAPAGGAPAPAPAPGSGGGGGKPAGGAPAPAGGAPAPAPAPIPSGGGGGAAPPPKGRQVKPDKKQEMTGLAARLGEELEKYGITNLVAKRAIVQTAAKESGLNPKAKESGAEAYLATLANRGLDYIWKVFPQLKPGGRVAKEKGFEKTGVPAEALNEVWSKGDEAFFDYVYGGLGTNSNPGDAYKYRGRGFVGITGRKVYENVGKEVGKDFVKDPDAVATDFNAASAALAGYLFSTRGGKDKTLRELNSMTDPSAALKYVLNTVAGLGHSASEFDKQGSHLQEQFRKASEFSSLANESITAANGGVFDGPKSGYAATLHGNEAVIPLKDGAVPVSMSQEFNMTATNLGELVNQMRSNMAAQDRMITVLEEIRRAQTTTADNTGKMAAYASN